MLKNFSKNIENLLIFSTLIIAGCLFLNSVDMFDFANAQLEKVTIDLYEAQFIPINETTNYLGTLVNFTTIDSSLIDTRINGVMQVYAPNGTLLKTSSYPNGFEISDSGTALFATHFTDQSLPSLTVNIAFTDLEKTEIISNTEDIVVPFDNEEGQERLGDKFFREVDEQLEKQQN